MNLKNSKQNEKNNQENLQSIKNTVMQYIGWGLDWGLDSLNLRNQNKVIQQDPILCFSQYIKNIQPHMQILKDKHKKKNQIRQLALQNIQLCYKQIPREFFGQNYQFDMPSAKTVRKTQEAFTDHLDLVQISLFSQVTSNFTQYLTLLHVIQELSDMVQLNLKKIQEGRDKIMKIQNKFLFRAMKLKQIIFKRDSLAKIVQLSKNINKFTNIISKMKSGLNEKKISLQLVQEFKKFSQNEYYQYENINIMSKVRNQFKLLKKKTIDVIKSLIRSKIIQYIKVPLRYDKQNWINQNISKNVISSVDCNNVSFALDITILDQTYFQPEEQIKDSVEATLYLYQLIQQAKILNIRDQELGKFVIQQAFQKFTETFNIDLKDYVEYVLQRGGVEVRKNSSLVKNLQNIEVGFYCKIIKMYYECIRQGFKRIQKLINSTLNSEYLMLVVENLHQFIISKIKYFMGLKKLPPNVDFKIFLRYLSLIDFWIQSETQLQNINLNSLQISKNQIIEAYLDNIHKQIMTVQLKQAIQNDKYVPVSIPSDYYVHFQYLINPSAQQTFQLLEGTLNWTLRRQNRKKMNHIDYENLRVINRVIEIKGQKYMACESFLLLIQILQQYLRMLPVMVTWKTRIQQKISQLLGFYNWYLRQMILNASITKLGNIKTISIKHLALVNSVIGLLQIIIQKLQLNPENKSKLEKTLINHQSQILKKISIIIVFKVEDELSALYSSRINSKPNIPTTYSRNILLILSSAKETLLEFFTTQKAKQLLSNGVKMLSKNYFSYLVTLSKRGCQQLEWFLPELDVLVGEFFQKQIQQMRQQLKRQYRSM